MSIFTVSCTPGIKFTSGKEINAKIATTPAEMEGLSKAEMRVANATLTRSVATMIDSATKNPDKYESWRTTVVALTELTKNPDEKITTTNHNHNHSVVKSIHHNNPKINNNTSEVTQIHGFIKTGKVWHPDWDVKGYIILSEDEASFLSKNPNCGAAKNIQQEKNKYYNKNK